MIQIARQFEKRDKHVQKMSHDGLVDKNLATGEETRTSQRGQDFNLRQNPQEAPRSFDPPARQPSIRQQLQDHQRPATEQPADFRQDDTRPADARPYGQDTGPADMPMEAATPTARSYEALSHESPAGPQPRRKQAAYDTQNTTDKATEAGPYETPSGPGATPHSVENPHNTHHNATADGPNVLHSPEQPIDGQRPGRLKYSEGQPQAPPGTKPKQHGTKYQQRFNPDAATSDEAIPDSTPAPDRPSRLKFGEDQPQDPTGAKSRQHGTKYQQRFTPEAAKPDAAKPDKADKPPVPDSSPPPAKTNRLQFTADERTPEPDKKLSKLQSKADKTAAKLDKARDKLPTKKRIKTRRVYDEAKGKAKTKIMFEKEVIPQGAKPPLSKRAGQAAGHAAGRGVTNKIDQKIAEVEKENVGVEAWHKGEQAVSRGSQHVTRSALRFVKERPYRRVAKLEKKAVKANIKLSYRQALNDNPKLKSNVLSRMAQKQKIKREYAKAARDAAKNSAKTAKKTGTVIGNIAKSAVAVVKRHPVVFGVIALILFVVFFFSTLFTSCSNMATSGMGAIFASSYLAEDADIDNSELIYTEWETDLQIEIANAESSHPGYDEYRYNVDDIGHNPYELMGYLTAAFQDFSYSEAQAVLQQIFAEQYQLSYVEEIEIRYRTETHTDSEGNSYDVEVPYEWYILNVNLTARSFTDVITPRLTSDEWEIYYLLMQTKGNRQYLISPFDFNWLPFVSSYYGWRVHPISGEKNYHKGVDIGVPTGTEILAGHDGIVTAAAYDAGGYGYYIVLDGEKGLQSKYAHCDTLLVSVGQQVKIGDVIAKSGNSGNSTGPHLHLEVLVNGQYLNPLYFAETNDDGSGGIPPGQPGGVAYSEYPGEPMTDANYAALMEEAMKHLGKPYVIS